MKKAKPPASTHPPPFAATMDNVYSIETVVQLTRTPRHQIAVYCRHGLISPVPAPERAGRWFDDDAIRMVRRIERLRVDHDLNLAGLRVIAELLREVERLRDDVRALRRP